MKFGKLVVQSSSRMTLHDRFSNLRGDQTDGSAQKRRQIVQATRKNQRLAQQMEHRPAVIAALRNTSRGKNTNYTARGGRGFLRGARGAARGNRVQVGGVIRRGGAVFKRPVRPVTGTPQSTIAANKPVGRGRGRGRGRGSVQKTSFIRPVTGTPQSALMSGGIRGAVRGGRGRGGVTRSAQISVSATKTTGGGGGVRNNVKAAASAAVSTSVASVKSRLSIQGRLSQPQPPKAFVQGGFQAGAATHGGGNFKGQGPYRGGRGGRGRGAYPARTFRGRGGRGGRGGGYSNQW